MDDLEPTSFIIRNKDNSSFISFQPLHDIPTLVTWGTDSTLGGTSTKVKINISTLHIEFTGYLVLSNIQELLDVCRAMYRDLNGKGEMIFGDHSYSDNWCTCNVEMTLGWIDWDFDLQFPEMEDGYYNTPTRNKFSFRSDQTYLPTLMDDLEKVEIDFLNMMRIKQ